MRPSPASNINDPWQSSHLTKRPLLIAVDSNGDRNSNDQPQATATGVSAAQSRHPRQLGICPV
jgi:hypothetical protein